MEAFFNEQAEDGTGPDPPPKVLEAGCLRRAWQRFQSRIDDFGAGPFGRCRAQRPVQQPQGGLAMITAGGAKLLKNALLVRTTGALVAPVDASQILALGR